MLSELFAEPLILADDCIILGPELLPADQESAELIRAIVGAARRLIGCASIGRVRRSVRHAGTRLTR